MLKFNQYPPTEISDVELTESAKTAIDRTIDGTHHEFEGVREKAFPELYGIGVAIGHTLLGAGVGERYSEFARPFAEIHFQIRAGIITALTDVKKTEEEGAVNV